MDHYETDSEPEEAVPSIFAAKRVRFHDSNEDWESDYTNMNLRVDKDIRDETVAGASPSSTSQHKILSKELEIQQET